MSLARAALPLACAWMAAVGSPASAQTRSVTSGRVHLEVDGCPAGTAAGVRRVLWVEIGDLLLDPSQGEPPDADRLVIRCAGDFASVEAAGLAGGAPTERMLRLDDFPGDAAPRALALLGVELLAARSAAVRDRILRRQTGAAPVTVAPVPPVPPPPAPRALSLGLAAVWRTVLAQDGASLFGGQLRADSAVERSGVAAADLEFAAGRKTVDGVGRATALLMSGAATIGLGTGGARWRATAGVGGRLGLLRESGSSADPAHVSGRTYFRPWGGPMLSAGLAGRLGRLAVRLGGEAGWSLLSADEVAAGATAMALRGPWVALSIGADLQVR